MELLNYNYDYKRLALNENLLSFYEDIVLHWQEITSTVPQNKRDVLSQNIWNNRFITVDKKILSTLVSCRYKTRKFSMNKKATL